MLHILEAANIHSHHGTIAVSEKKREGGRLRQQKHIYYIPIFINHDRFINSDVYNKINLVGRLCV